MKKKKKKIVRRGFSFFFVVFLEQMVFVVVLQALVSEKLKSIIAGEIASKRRICLLLFTFPFHFQTALHKVICCCMEFLLVI